MCSEGYSTWPVIQSVRTSVFPSVCYHVFCHYAKQGGQKAFQCHTGLILKMAIFVKILRLNVMARKPSQQVNMLMSMAYLDQILPVSSTVEAVEVTQRASYVVLVCQKHYLLT